MAAPSSVQMVPPCLPPVLKRRRLREKTTMTAVPAAQTATVAPTPMSELAPVRVAEVNPAQILLQLLRAEVEDCRFRLAASRPMGAGRQCPLCPWYTCAVGGVDIHLQDGHGAGTQHVASGTKQLRMCMALYEADLYRGAMPGLYLQRTSAMLRESVLPAPSPKMQRIDDFMRMVLDRDGPRMVAAEAAARQLSLRRVGNILYTRDFAEAFLREVLLSRCSLRTATSRMQTTFMLAGSSLGSLTPENPKSMNWVLQDILGSPAVTAWLEALAASAWEAGEGKVLTIDGTFKIGMGIIGHGRSLRKLPGVARPPAPRVLTTRGTSGFLHGLQVVQDEAGQTIGMSLQELIPEQARRSSVQFVVVDHASRELQKALKEFLPNLRCVCEDTEHLVMKVKNASGNRETPMSRELAAVLAKFNRPDTTHVARNGRACWTWDSPPAASDECKRLLQHARDMRLPAVDVREATRLRAESGTLKCYRDYLLCMAALVANYPSQMSRRLGTKGKTVHKVLLAACTFARYGSYANNTILRNALDHVQVSLVASGTTANEALHGELRAVFRQVYSIQEHTMRMRLSSFLLAKRVAWDAARRTPGLRQRQPFSVLCLALARPLIDEESWSLWVRSHADRLAVPKSLGEMRAAIRRHVGGLKKRLRPLRAPRPAHAVKRTVFTMRRVAHLTGGGRTWGAPHAAPGLSTLGEPASSSATVGA